MLQKYREKLQELANEVVATLAEKDDAYGSSWKAMGGFSAFFNLHRKFARIEVSSKMCNYDVFRAVKEIKGSRDALHDLIGYALLILAETEEKPTDIGGAPLGEPIDKRRLIDGEET